MVEKERCAGITTEITGVFMRISYHKRVEEDFHLRSIVSTLCFDHEQPHHRTLSPLHGRGEVESLVRDCFWDLYRPGALEHLLLRAIRKQDNYLPELEFVLTDGNEIIGQNIFFPGIIESEEGN